MQASHEFRRISVELRALAEAIQAEIGKLIGRGAERRLVHFQIVLQKPVKGLRARIEARVLEIFAADIFVETKRLEEVAVAITRHRGNSHPGQHFAQSAVDGLAYALEYAVL